MDLDDVLAVAQRLLLEVGEVTPLVLVQGSAGSTQIPLSEIPEDREQKIRLLLRVGYAVGQDPKLGGLEQVVVLFEGWMSRGSGPVPTVMPADDPHHQEVLSIATYHPRPPRSTLALFTIVRSSDAQRIELERVPDVAEPGMQASSPLLDAFVYGYEEGRKAR